MTARYDTLKREDLKPEHQEIWDGVAKARKGRVPAPFQVLLVLAKVGTANAGIGEPQVDRQALYGLRQGAVIDGHRGPSVAGSRCGRGVSRRHGSIVNGGHAYNSG